MKRQKLKLKLAHIFQEFITKVPKFDINYDQQTYFHNVWDDKWKQTGFHYCFNKWDYCDLLCNYQLIWTLPHTKIQKHPFI